MTKKILAIALLTAAVALVGCSKSEEATVEGAAAEEGAHHAKSSSAGLPAGNAEVGAKLASAKNAKTGQACIDCHGAEGNAPIDPTYPKLAGQYGDYIAHSLVAYREGKRENALMAGQATELTDQQIADLGAYFGTRNGNLRDLHGLQ